MVPAHCPNCGGYIVDEGIGTVVATHLVPISLSVFSILTYLVFIAFGGWVIATGLGETCLVYSHCPINVAIDSMIISIRFGNFAQDTSTTKILVGIAIILIFVAGFIRQAKGRAMKKVPSVWQYNFSCQICGYRWTWRTDDPYPKVNLNPALIQRGVQMVEDQRCYYEQMQASWWFQQQQKK